MRRTVAWCLVALLALQPGAAAAQQAAPAPGTPQPPQQVPSAAEAPSVPPTTVEALGVSFERIKASLTAKGAKPSPDESLLRLDYYLEVVAFAPPIQIFTPEELAATGPVPGAPITHREMVREIFTKPEFKSQSVPIVGMALVGLVKLTQWQITQIRRERAEAERKKREEELKKKYPELVVKDRGKE